VVGEALECLGGNGYVEESGLPRLYRDAPLNSIWEGSATFRRWTCLRAVAPEPDSLDAFRPRWRRRPARTGGSTPRRRT
jgi:putative acyl-CoA dehydrogenase